MTILYTKMQIADTLDNDLWMRASNESLGCLWRLLMLASRRANGGRFLCVKGLSHKACVLVTGVTAREIKLVIKNGLASWSGEDLVVTGYDHVGMDRLERLTDVGRQQGHHGKAGGRPKKTPVGVIPEPQQGLAQETPPRVLEKPPISNTITNNHDQPVNTTHAGEPDHAIFDSPTAARTAEKNHIRALMAASTPQQKWNLRAELMPWSVEIERAGGIIRSTNFTAWDGIRERHGMPAILATIAKIGPCWDGDCEKAIRSSSKPDLKTIAADAAASKYGKRP